MLLDKLIIKGNEIKEPGVFGKTLYIIKGNEIKQPGFFGKTLYVIKGNEIKEPGFFGKTVFVIKGNEIRTPDQFGQTVAKAKANGTIVYNKPQSTKNNAASHANSKTLQISETSDHIANIEDYETLDELQKRLENAQGCVVDYSNCSPEKTDYSIPQKYSKLTAIAPALNLETIKIHSKIALIAISSVNVKKAFIVDANNLYYSSDNGILYNKEKTVLLRVPYKYDISSLVIPDTVRIIGEYAFFGCSMNEFIVPNSVLAIGQSAFAFCKKFKSIFIPQTVKTIGKNAFEYDKTFQIITNAESKPTGWNLDEASLKKPIKWGVK